MKYLLIFASVFLFLQCEDMMESKSSHPKPGPIASAFAKNEFSFRLTQPDSVMELDKDLKEISGLAWHDAAQMLLANNDEKGKIFFLAPENGEIKKELDFDNKGDYEGIEQVGDAIYLIESKGDLFEIKMMEDDELQVKEYETPLKKDYDVEGLTFLPEKQMLLLVCKGQKIADDKKFIYSFDLQKKAMLPQPILTIEKSLIEKFLEQNSPLSRSQQELFTRDFSPSGMAIHPQTKEWYMLSSVGKMLFVFAPDGQIRHIEYLDKSLFPQPEGICFHPSGKQLFIATEGKKGKGALLKFSSTKDENQ